jgi:hypothetical protein
MKFELNSHILIAHWVPGFILVMALRARFLNSPPPLLKSSIGLDAPGDEAILALVLVVVAFVAGEILDASRDLLENLWDRLQTVKWEFFTDAAQDEIEKIKTSHFTYYAFDCNISLTLIILLCCFFSQILQNGSTGFISLGIFIAIIALFAWNAGSLRKEIADRTERWAQSMHTHG